MANPNFIIKFTNVLGDFVQFRESLIVFGLERFGLERGNCINVVVDSKGASRNYVIFCY